jgi:hypothetical protein
VWRLGGKDDASKFLTNIYPHTVVKREQIWLALEYWAQNASVNVWKMTDEVRALREGYKLALQYLKGTT